MTITHTCEACGHHMGVPDQHAGRRLYCSSCQQPFVVALPDGAPAPSGTCPQCAATLPAGAVFCNQCGTNLTGGASARRAPPRPTSGGSSVLPWLLVSVVGGMVVIAVLGIIAAIAIPNFIAATQRGRQKRTMADMRAIATATEAYRLDNETYPVGVTSIDELASSISPTYLAYVPQTDGWSNPFLVQTTEDGSSFTIMSYGRDAVENAYVGGEVPGFDTDMIYEDGVWVQWPEGIPRP